MNEKCPRCGNTTWYGPAEVRFDDGGDYHYYECRKCNAFLTFPGRPKEAAKGRN